MSLPIEVEKAIADEKAKRSTIGTEQELAALIEQEKIKVKAPPEEKKEEVKPEKSEVKADSTKAMELISERVFGRKQKEKADEKKEGTTEEDKSGDAVGGEAGADSKPAAGEQTPVVEGKKKAKISKKPEIDPIEIASAAAARTAHALMARDDTRDAKAPKETAGDGIESALNEDEKGELEVFREMAKADTKYREHPKQYIAYLKKAEDYQRQWEKDHPNEDFTPEASEHDSFYAKNQPKYSELDYKKAVSRMVQREEGDQRVQELTAKQKKLEAELAARDLDPVINQTSIGALAEVIKIINPDILKAIEKEGFQKYAEGNEVEADLIKEAAARMGPFIAGLLQFDDPDGRIPFNDKNPAHIEAVRYLREKEQELGKKSWRERMNEDGKVIVPRAEYFRMSDAQKAQHAYLDTAMLLQLRIQEEASKAQAQYEKELKKAEARAKALGWVPPSRKENGHKEQEKKVESTANIKEEVKSPEAGSSSRIDTTGDVQNKAKKDVVNLVADILRRR